jgi:hypothetical protein
VATEGGGGAFFSSEMAGALKAATHTKAVNNFAVLFIVFSIGLTMVFNWNRLSPGLNWQHERFFAVAPTFQ